MNSESVQQFAIKYQEFDEYLSKIFRQLLEAKVILDPNYRPNADGEYPPAHTRYSFDHFSLSKQSFILHGDAVEVYEGVDVVSIEVPFWAFDNLDAFIAQKREEQTQRITQYRIERAEVENAEKRRTEEAERKKYEELKVKFEPKVEA